MTYARANFQPLIAYYRFYRNRTSMKTELSFEKGKTTRRRKAGFQERRRKFDPLTSLVHLLQATSLRFRTVQVPRFRQVPALMMKICLHAKISPYHPVQALRLHNLHLLLQHLGLLQDQSTSPTRRKKVKLSLFAQGSTSQPSKMLSELESRIFSPRSCGFQRQLPAPSQYIPYSPPCARNLHPRSTPALRIRISSHASL